jgi:hypothetical protein
MCLLLLLPLPRAFLQQPLAVKQGRQFVPLISLSSLDVNGYFGQTWYYKSVV